MATIYKIVPANLWEKAKTDGEFLGAPVDLEDGYIHFSTSAQVHETAAKHFKNQTDLLLVSVHSKLLEDRLKWEESRGGDLFPHLYGKLSLNEVESVASLPLGPDGKHEFPELKD